MEKPIVFFFSFLYYRELRLLASLFCYCVFHLLCFSVLMILCFSVFILLYHSLTAVFFFFLMELSHCVFNLCAVFFTIIIVIIKIVIPGVFMCACVFYALLCVRVRVRLGGTGVYPPLL